MSDKIIAIPRVYIPVSGAFQHQFKADSLSNLNQLTDEIHSMDSTSSMWGSIASDKTYNSAGSSQSNPWGSSKVNTSSMWGGLGSDSKQGQTGSSYGYGSKGFDSAWGASTGGSMWK